MLDKPAGRKPRTCIVSMRRFNRLASSCSNYEFEDVIASVDDATLLAPAPKSSFSYRKWMVERMYWRKGLHHLASMVDIGLDPLYMDTEHDLLVMICGKTSDLIFLNSIKDWRHKAKKKICILVELWANMIPDYRFHLEILREFDHTFLCFNSTVEPFRTALNLPCSHLPLGVDVVRFSPFPSPPEKCVDVLSMGRRLEATHREMMEMAARREIFYIYDTIPGMLVQPRDHREHREMLSNTAKRSKMFVTYPAKVDVHEETHGQSEVGARYFEGAAAGAALVGKAPSNPLFSRDFCWDDALFDLGSTQEEAFDRISSLLKQPERLRMSGLQNAVGALRGFDWAHRWETVLDRLGMEHLPALRDRTRLLSEMAETAQAHLGHRIPAAN